MSLEKSQKFSLAVVQELKRIREEKGISQQKLAEAAGLSRAMIQHMEKGIRNPTLMVIKAVAEALDVSLSKITAKVEKAKST